MKQRMHELVQECFMDLEEACQSCGESLDAESLADFLGDRMYDESAEYRAMSYAQRREITLKVAQNYC